METPSEARNNLAFLRFQYETNAAKINLRHRLFQLYIQLPEDTNSIELDGRSFTLHEAITHFLPETTFKPPDQLAGKSTVTIHNDRVEFKNETFDANHVPEPPYENYIRGQKLFFKLDKHVINMRILFETWGRFDALPEGQTTIQYKGQWLSKDKMVGTLIQESNEKNNHLVPEMLQWYNMHLVYEGDAYLLIDLTLTFMISPAYADCLGTTHPELKSDVRCPEVFFACSRLAETLKRNYLEPNFSWSDWQQNNHRDSYEPINLAKMDLKTCVKTLCFFVDKDETLPGHFYLKMESGKVQILLIRLRHVLKKHLNQ